MPRLGYHGESAPEAIKDALVYLGNRASYKNLFAETRKRGTWKDRNIWITLMAEVVNLPPSYDEWPNENRFLFLREDGSYELYSAELHGKFIKGEKIS